MTSVILTPNREPPYNLQRTQPNWNDPDYAGMSESAILSAVIKRLKQVGVVPCETEAERDRVFAEFAEKHAEHPDVIPLVLPAIGPHWIVDETDLPGGAITPENDVYFDAWEWRDGKVQINREKVRVLKLGLDRLSQ